MLNTVVLPALMDQRKAAEYLGISEKKLERDRWIDKRITYVKVGRHVRYRAADLLEYIEANVVRAR